MTIRASSINSDGARYYSKEGSTAKNKFPTDVVYGDLDHAGLRLITCGGVLNPAGPQL